MKKNFIIVSVLSLSIMLSSCGMTGGNTGLLGGSTGTNTGSALASAGTGVLGTLLTSLLGNTTTVNSIAGTWTYSAPKVAFESQNVLAQIGSSVASSKIESTLDSQLKKLGFQSGKTTITFGTDGSCQMIRNGKTFNGTYTYNQSAGQMTIQGALGVATITPYVSVMGNEMYMLFDSDKLLSVMGALSNVAKTTTLSNLLGNYNGLKLGWTMVRN